MFSKLAIFFIAAAALVSATPGDEPAGTVVFNKTTNKCNVGKLQCCKSVQSVNSQAVQNQAGIVGVALGQLGLAAGLNCDPISVLVAVGAGANCNATPACCKGNTFGGVVTAGCTPINANL